MTAVFTLTLSIIMFLPVINRAQETSTFQIIQTQIFNTNCISCHQPGTSFARQSGLVLTEGSAFGNLVDVVPKNAAAVADGLVRVTSEGGEFAPHKSFLWEKINAPEQNHFYQDHQNYGSLMPLGLDYLTNGQLAFIKQWMIAGAPASEAVANVTLLADTTRYTPPDFVALDPPQKGFQLHLGPYDVWPAELHDREFMYYQPYPTTEDIFVTRYEISITQNSHHFLLYNYPDGTTTPIPNVFRDVRNAQGVGNIVHLIQLGNLFPFQLFIGTQLPYLNYYFPPGVALRLPAGSGFDLNSHSVNRSGEPQQGEVYVNIHTVDPGEVQRAADYDFFGNFNISLPPNATTTLTYDGFFDEKRQIIQMWSHSHEHTLEFNIYRIGGEDDGERIYWTSDWEHPPFLGFDPPLTVNPGEGFRLVTTYDNWTNNKIEFGPLSSDEMQFVFFLYYTGEVVASVDQETLPENFRVEQNYPNPFNPATKIRYSLPKNGLVTLKIYNVLGREVQTLISEIQTQGEHLVEFDGSALSSGIYFYKLEAAGLSEVKKMILMK
ncbi:T9SS type A sorting domain-containing protein [candidate division KSB1 bacterium]|nr:T9SS type A sorting domain-containing protein [candidate division KSB1 bacterium]